MRTSRSTFRAGIAAGRALAGVMLLAMAASPLGPWLAPGAMAEEAAPASSEKSVQLPSIIVVKAVRQPITESVRGSGIVRPVDEVYVQPQVEGLAVDAAKVDVGDRVAAGEVMAVLSRDSLTLEKSRLEASLAKSQAAVAQLQAAVAEAQANAEEANRVRERYRTLSLNGTFSTAQFDQADAEAKVAAARVNSAEQNLEVGRADVAVAKAQIADVELRLSRTEVKAPVAGIVSAKNLKIGAIASAGGEPMFTIIRDGALELRAEVSEEDLLKVKAGEKVTVSVPGDSRPVTATVRLVEPTVDLTSRLATVRIAFDDTDRIRAGMFAEAAITVATKDAVTVPVPTVTFSGGEATVLKVADGRVAVTKVQTGIRDDSRIEIVSGLADGDLVVAKAGAFVRDGDRINPVEAPASSADAEAAATTVGN